MPDANGMPLDSDVCECGVLVLDHTLRLFKEHHPANELNLPYDESGGRVDTPAGSHGPMAGAVVVKSAVIETGGRGGLPKAVPAIAFTFLGPDGLTAVAKAILVLDVERMRAVRLLIGEAIDGSITAARRIR
jgi:hypothetical protein